MIAKHRATAIKRNFLCITLCFGLCFLQYIALFTFQKHPFITPKRKEKKYYLLIPNVFSLLQSFSGATHKISRDSAFIIIYVTVKRDVTVDSFSCGWQFSLVTNPFHRAKRTVSSYTFSLQSTFSRCEWHQLRKSHFMDHGWANLQFHELRKYMVIPYFLMPFVSNRRPTSTFLGIQLMKLIGRRNWSFPLRAHSCDGIWCRKLYCLWQF